MPQPKYRANFLAFSTVLVSSEGALPGHYPDAG